MSVVDSIIANLTLCRHTRGPLTESVQSLPTKMCMRSIMSSLMLPYQVAHLGALYM